jgi:hypothetical protein
MNRYETSMPRAVFAVAALGMTVLTLAVAVVLPANLELRGPETFPLTAANARTPVVADDARAGPMRVHVTGECEQDTAFERTRGVAPGQQQHV